MKISVDTLLITTAAVVGLVLIYTARRAANAPSPNGPESIYGGYSWASVDLSTTGADIRARR